MVKVFIATVDGKIEDIVICLNEVDEDNAILKYDGYDDDRQSFTQLNFKDYPYFSELTQRKIAEAIVERYRKEEVA